jgi:hypothetical protein
VGVTEVGVFLQDYDQVHLQPLGGRGLTGQRVPIAGSAAGRAFVSDDVVEEGAAGRVGAAVPADAGRLGPGGRAGATPASGE